MIFVSLSIVILSAWVIGLAIRRKFPAKGLRGPHRWQHDYLRLEALFRLSSDSTDSVQSEIRSVLKRWRLISGLTIAVIIDIPYGLARGFPLWICGILAVVAVPLAVSSLFGIGPSRRLKRLLRPPDEFRSVPR